MAYSRVNWQDKPSTATPINAENLNKMDKGINDLEEGKISKTDIVQTDTINDPAKVPSSAVTYGLGQEIAQLNNNLAWEEWQTATLQKDWAGTIKYTKNGFNVVKLVLAALIPGNTAGLTIIATLPAGYRPERNVLIQLANSSGWTSGAIMYLNQNGNLYLANDSSFSSAGTAYGAQVHFYAS